MSTLLEEILKAHVAVQRGEPGAHARLETLKTAYRSSGTLIRTGGTATIKRGTAPPARPKRPSPSRAQPAAHHWEPGNGRSQPRELVPELCRDARPTLTVRLSRQAVDEINRELTATARWADLCETETGGCLIGIESRKAIEVVDASGPESRPEGDDKVRRLPGAVTISGVPGFEIAEELMRSRRDHSSRVWIGTWHTHPDPVPEPSTTDRRDALRGLDLLREGYGWRSPRQFIDLILHPHDVHGWRSPRIAGWATRWLPYEGGGPVTEPVNVEEV